MAPRQKGRSRAAVISGVVCGGGGAAVLEDSRGAVTTLHRPGCSNDVSVVAIGTALAAASATEAQPVLLLSANRRPESVLVHLMAARLADKSASVVAALRSLLREVPGGYSIIIVEGATIFAARDCYGLKPLFIGSKADKDSLVDGDIESSRPLAASADLVSSSSDWLERAGASLIRQVLPGEIVELGPEGTGCRSLGIVYRPSGDARTMCAMEYVTLSRDEARLEGREESVAAIRSRLGQEEARLAAVQGDPEEDEVAVLVTRLPTVPVAFLMGYCQETKDDMADLFYHLVEDDKNTEKIALFGGVSILNKVLVVVLDTLLNSDLTTAVQLLRDAGARQVHIRVCSPHILDECPFAVSLPHHPSPSIINSIHFLPKSSLAAVIAHDIPRREVDNVSHCFHCFGYRHPLLNIPDF